MRVPSWLRSLTPSRALPTPRRLTFRPRVEALEYRLTPSGGLLDPTFGADGIATTPSAPGERVYAVAVQPDGRILAAGDAFGTTADFFLTRYNADGSLDAAFGSGGRVTTDFNTKTDRAHAVSVQPGTGGKILVAGYANTGKGPNDVYAFAVARYNANGTLDTAFGGGKKPTGKVTVDFSSEFDTAYSMAVLPDGKFVLAGRAGWNLALARFNANGTLDTTFGSGGKVVGPAMSGSSTQQRYVGLTVDGSGRLVVASTVGEATVTQEGRDFLVVRFLPTGQLDPAFGAGGVVRTDVAPGLSDGASSVVVQPDGRILVGGAASYVTTYNGQVITPNQFALVRYNPNGSLDAGFGTNGVVTAVADLSQLSGGEISGVSVRPDGSILAGGRMGYPPNLRGAALMRFDAAGNRDLSFGSPGAGGAVTLIAGAFLDVQDMAVQPDGRVILAGSLFNDADPLLARYLVSAPQVTSFTASPNPVTAGSAVTLAAAVAAGNPGALGGVTQVAFYADSNNDGVLDPATDALLGYATYDSGSGQWRLTVTTASWAPGTHRLFARAQDGYGAWGDPVAITLEVI